MRFSIHRYHLHQGSQVVFYHQKTTKKKTIPLRKAGTQEKKKRQPIAILLRIISKEGRKAGKKTKSLSENDSKKESARPGRAIGFFVFSCLPAFLRGKGFFCVFMGVHARLSSLPSLIGV
jgi:hypothetical protein